MRTTRKQQQPVEKEAQKPEEVKKEKGKKKVAVKPQPPPALTRTTRSQTVVEVVIETSQPTPSATATATTSRGRKAPPSTPKRPTRSAAAAKPVPIAVARTPSPKKPVAGHVKARKAVTPVPAPVPAPVRVSSTPPSVEASRLSPEILVPASSDAENHTPLSSHYASSPPAITPTTPVRRRRVALEFTADAGYTPPRARPGSAERPRLRELGPETLEPLDTLLDGFDDEFEGPPPPSPTPKRMSTWRYSESSRHALPIDDEDAPTSAQPERRVGSPTYLQKGKSPAIPAPASEEDDVFTIYSDPRSLSPALPSNSNIRELEEVARPPISSSEPPSPQKGKKRRSSGAVVDSDEDVLQVQVTAPAPNTRGGKRRKQQLEKLKSMKTDDLRDLLPRRRRRAAEKDEFDITTTTPSSPESSSDELSMPKHSRRGGKKKNPPPPPTHSAKKGKAPAGITKSAWSRPLVPGVSKKYGRKSTGSEKENQSPNRQRKALAVGNLSDEEGSSSSATTTIADGALHKEGRKKLQLVAEKFKEVDQWEMEFEDVSLVTESSLENAR